MNRKGASRSRLSVRPRAVRASVARWYERSALLDQDDQETQSAGRGASGKGPSE